MNDSASIERVLGGLSQRQCQVLYWIFQDLEYVEIGRKLGFDEKTIQGDMSKVYRLFGMTRNSVPEKRRFLDREVRPIYERLVSNPATDCSTRSTTQDVIPPDPAGVAEVAEDARKGFVPLRAMIVIPQPEPIRPPPPPLPRNLINSASRDLIDMRDRSGGPSPIPWVFVGILGTLLLVAIGFIAFLLWQSSLHQPADAVVATPRPIRQTVVVTGVPVAIPQTVVVPNTVIVQQTVVVSQNGTAVPESATEIPQPQRTSIPSTSAPTPVRANAVFPSFSDNFDNGVSSLWKHAGGDWRMANGQLVNTGPLGTLWLGKAEWTDVYVDVDFQGGNCDNDPIQILLHMQDTQNFVAVRISGCRDEGIYIYRSGTGTKIVAGDCCAGHWRFEVKGNIYEVYKDGKLIESVSDDSYPSGSVGIQMGNGRQVDNFSVSSTP